MVHKVGRTQLIGIATILALFFVAEWATCGLACWSRTATAAPLLDDDRPAAACK